MLQPKIPTGLILTAPQTPGVISKLALTCWVKSEDYKNVRRKKSLRIITASSFKSYANVKHYSSKQYTTHKGCNIILKNGGTRC